MGGDPRAREEEQKPPGERGDQGGPADGEGRLDLFYRLRPSIEQDEVF